MRTKQFVRQVQMVLAVAIIIALITFGVVIYTSMQGCSQFEVQQGNVLDTQQVRQLRVGMTKKQVNYLLGHPAIRDTFHINQWVYLSYSPPNEPSRVVVYFKDDKVIRIKD